MTHDLRLMDGTDRGRTIGKRRRKRDCDVAVFVHFTNNSWIKVWSLKSMSIMEIEMH